MFRFKTFDNEHLFVLKRVNFAKAYQKDWYNKKNWWEKK